MTRTLEARGIKVIVIPGVHTWAEGKLLPDGHPNAAGHQAVAARLLPLVVAAIRGK